MTGIGSLVKGSVMKYLLIGGLAAALPNVVSNFLPFAGPTAAIALAGVGMFMLGKVPYVGQALIVGAGLSLVGPLIGGAIGGLGGSSGGDW